MKKTLKSLIAIALIFALTLSFTSCADIAEEVIEEVSYGFEELIEELVWGIEDLIEDPFGAVEEFIEELEYMLL